MRGLTLWLGLILMSAPHINMAFQNLSEPELREMKEQGDMSLDFIMNVVMMGLPSELMAVIKTQLLTTPMTEKGFQFSQPQNPQVPLPPTPPPSPDTSIKSNGGTTIDLNSVNSNEPIQLKRKKRQSFFPNKNSFNTNSFGNNALNNINLGNSGFGNTGFDLGGKGLGSTGLGSTGYGSTGLGSTGFGSTGFGNIPGKNVFGTTSGTQGFGNTNTGKHVFGNGNLIGGNARSFINYPGDVLGGNRGKHPSFDSFFGSSSNNNNNCPRQADQGFIYQYSDIPLTYPALLIANELFIRSLPGSDLLTQALVREVVFPTDPPQVFLDPFLLFANATCRFLQRQLWSYESAKFPGRCYPLVNFQETPFYRTCLNRFCKNCESSNFFYGQQANVCTTEYETVSLWSFCEQLIVGSQIVRDRIIVPKKCTCTTVNCGSQFH